MAMEDWQRLADAVRERREYLGLTQQEVAIAGGPSTATQRLIEGALGNSYRAATYRQIEAALHWRPGSVRDVLAGGYPQPIGDPLPGMAGDLETASESAAEAAVAKLLGEMAERVGLEVRTVRRDDQRVDLVITYDDSVALVDVKNAIAKPSLRPTDVTLAARRHSGPRERDVAAGPQDPA